MVVNATLLVVDDDQDIAANLADILQDRGYRVDRAHCGVEALQLIGKTSYDAALLDFKMPDMDGATLFARMRQVQPELIAILVTAYASNDGVQRAKAAGTWKVMRKPVDIPTMLSYVDQALGLDAVDL